MAKATKKPAAKAAPKAKPAAKAAAKPAKSAKAPAAKAAKPAKAPKAAQAEEVEVLDAAAPEAEVEAAAEAPAKVKKPKAKKEKSAKALAAEKAIADENRKWGELRDKYAAEKAASYSMSGVFEANKPLMHKVLGWGFVTSVQNDRLEVLFEQGTKLLISNYKTK